MSKKRVELQVWYGKNDLNRLRGFIQITNFLIYMYNEKTFTYFIIECLQYD